MSRLHITDHRERHIERDHRERFEAEGPEAGEHEHGLPPVIHARVTALGPGDSHGLHALLIEHPTFSAGIIAVASPQMGLASVQRAVIMTQPTAAPAAPEVAPAPTTTAPTATTEPAAPTATDAKAEADAPPIAAPIIEPPQQSAGPSQHAIAAALQYNQAHSHFVVPFNRATSHSCIGSSGELDPVAVWAWQGTQGIKQDGCVGPETAKTATSLVEQAPAEPKQPEPETSAMTTAAPPPQLEAHVAVTAAPTATVAPTAITAPTPQAPEAAPAPIKPVAEVTAAPAKPAVEAAPVAAAPAVEAAPVAPAPAARPDDGGPGSLARRVFPGHGTADQAFGYLVNPNDAILDKNLADYGGVADQRALLDGVIAEGATDEHVRRAFHAYWHVQLQAAVAQGAKPAKDWPTATLQAFHHQLKLLPDGDARTGAWKKLSLSNDAAKAGRGWYGGDNFSLGADATGSLDNQQFAGIGVPLTQAAPAGATSLQVVEGDRFKVGDTIALDRTGPHRDPATISAISGNTYTLSAPLHFAHSANDAVVPDNDQAQRKINWLDNTIRHEIAHSLDGNAVDAKGFYALGGWHSGGIRDWAAAMGPDAWKTKSPNVTLTDDDKTAIQAGIQAAMMQGARSLFDVFKPEADKHLEHPIATHRYHGVAIMEAAETSMRQGDGFVANPTSLAEFNGKRFSVSYMYGRFQYCSETALADRVTNYSMTAPAEFFAEAYAMFYEEAGQPGVADADYGRLIRNTEWRNWLRENVHDRGHGPSGTGAAKAPGGGPTTDDHGAKPGGANRGRASGNPGM